MSKAKTEAVTVVAEKQTNWAREVLYSNGTKITYHGFCPMDGTVPIADVQRTLKMKRGVYGGANDISIALVYVEDTLEVWRFRGEDGLDHLMTYLQTTNELARGIIACTPYTAHTIPVKI